MPGPRDDTPGPGDERPAAGGPAGDPDGSSGAHSTEAGGAAAVVAALRRRGLTLATAESLTGGLVGAVLTAVPGASSVYRGGFIAYATELKHTLLGVDPAELARVGAVASGTAAAMARGARHRAGADLGIATTGVAGPAPQEGHPPGTVFVGLADSSGAVVRELRLSGDRGLVRAGTVEAVLALVLERLGAEPDMHRGGGRDDTAAAGR